MTTPRRNRVDLHCHTSRSDGVLAPLALHEEMRRWGMRIVAISDHDTLDGYRELRAAGLGQPAERGSTPSGPLVVPAVEINSIASDFAGLWEGELHILGYGVDPDDAAFEVLLARQRAGRTERAERILERLRELDLPVDDVLPRTLTSDVRSPGRPHFARALVAAGHAVSVDDAMQHVLARGAPGYVARLGMGSREAVEAIRAAGGIPSLAHFPAAPERTEVVSRLQDWGLGGLEVHYAAFDDRTVARMMEFAARRGLLATGGSDFHGDTWTYAQAQAATRVPDEVGERLLAAIVAARQAPAGPAEPSGRGG